MNKIKLKVLLISIFIIIFVFSIQFFKDKDRNNQETIEINHSYENLLIGYWYQDAIGIYTGEYNTQDKQEIKNVISMLESSTIINVISEIEVDDNMAWLNLTSAENTVFIGIMESGFAKVNNEYFIELSDELLAYLDKHNVYEAVRVED